MRSAFVFRGVVPTNTHHNMHSHAKTGVNWSRLLATQLRLPATPTLDLISPPGRVSSYCYATVTTCNTIYVIVCAVCVRFNYCCRPQHRHCNQRRRRLVTAPSPSHRRQTATAGSAHHTPRKPGGRISSAINSPDKRAKWRTPILLFGSGEFAACSVAYIPGVCFGLCVRVLF